MFLRPCSVVQSDDSPMQTENVVDPQTTSMMLKGLDRHSHYRFFLMGRTAAGLGEPIKKDGATTLEGCKCRAHNWKPIAPSSLWSFRLIPLSKCLAVPPANISLLAEEKSVNLSWEARRRHRNIGFQIRYLNKNGTKSAFSQSFNSIVGVISLHRIDSSPVHVLLQMAASGRRRRRWTLPSYFTSSRAWPPAPNTACSSPTGTTLSGRLRSRQKEQVLQALLSLHPSLLSSFSAPSSGLPTSKYKTWSCWEYLPVLSSACETFSKACISRELG